MDRWEYFLYLNQNNFNDKLNELKEFGLNNQIPIIQDAGLNFIKMLIKINKVQKILEIGTAIGYSALNFVLMDDKITVDTIERDDKMISYALENFQAFSMTNRIRLFACDALEIGLESLQNDYDLLFIDAAKAQYQKFFEIFTKCLKPGGIVVTDNLIFHDLIFASEIPNRNTRSLVKKIKNYNEWLKDNPDFTTFFFDIGDGIALSIKK